MRDVRVFGSVAHGDDTADSDIDLLVDLQGRSALDLIAFQDEVARVLTVPVDVVPGSPRLADWGRHMARAEAVPLSQFHLMERGRPSRAVAKAPYAE